MRAPLPASTTTASVSSAKKRKISQREKTGPRSRTDLFHAHRGRKYNKSCALCKQTGHNRTNCLKLLENYGKFPIPLTDISQRKKTAMSLNTSALNGSPLFRRDSSDNRPIITEFPKQIK